VVALIVKSPWWVVVGLVSGGFVWASSIQGEVREVKSVVEDGRSPPIIQMRRSMDSLLIETRHTNETLNRILDRLDAPLPLAPRRPIP